MELLRWLRAVDRRAVVFWAGYLAGGLLLWVVFAVWVPAAQYRQKSITVKQNMHAVQLALERFACDSNGSYPVDIAEISTAGYMPRFPRNPFTGVPMRAYPPGSTPPAGDFIYEPICQFGAAEGEADSYNLQLFY